MSKNGVSNKIAARLVSKPAPPRLYATRYSPFGREVVEIANKASGYGVAETLRESGRALPITQSSDAHARYDLELIRAESQRLDRDNAIAQAMMTRVCDVVLGDGCKLQAKTPDAGLNRAIEALWAEWWGCPEVRGMDGGASLERLLLRHYLVDGDVLVYLDNGPGLIQIIPADQIKGPGGVGVQPNSDGTAIEQGVALDRLRRPTQFYVAPVDAQGWISTAAEPLPAEKCIFLANRRRVDQTRGEPVMQSAFPMLHRINDVCDSEAAAWQLLSRLAVKILRKDAGQQAFGTSQVDDGATDADIATRYHDIGSAIIFHGEPGEDIGPIDHSMPGANFVESLKMFLRLLGMPLGFSLEFTLLIWSDTNYSSGRASIKQVERNCRPYRNALRAAMSRIYRWKLEQWATDKLIPASAISAHAFHFHPYPFIDPQKEAQAQTDAIKSGLTTLTREALQNGDEFADVLAERARDLADIAEAVRKHNTAYPDAPVTIADFMPIAGGTPIAAAPTPAPEATP